MDGLWSLLGDFEDTGVVYGDLYSAKCQYIKTAKLTNLNTKTPLKKATLTVDNKIPYMPILTIPQIHPIHIHIINRITKMLKIKNS